MAAKALLAAGETVEGWALLDLVADPRELDDVELLTDAIRHGTDRYGEPAIPTHRR